MIAALLSPVISPMFRSTGWDPSVFAGLVFANDSGGSVLALEMADDPQMGRYSGLSIGAMLRTTVMFIIPHINEPSLTGFLLTFANGIPVCSILEKIDDRGRMINVAFLVSASCLLGDHLAYTSQADAAMCVPVLVGKLVSGVLAILLSLVLAPKVLSQKT